MSRRKVWRLIENLKKDKILILTTHSLDEADLLSDKIGIMALGQLRYGAFQGCIKINERVVRKISYRLISYMISRAKNLINILLWWRYYKLIHYTFFFF